MAFTFIHTADLHLGRAFDRTLGRGDAAAALRAARLTALDTLAELAREHAAAHILVAGDVFHSQNLKRDTLRKTIAHMTAHADVTWHLLPGNHDHMQAGGVWQAFTNELGTDTNVVVHTARAAHEIEPGVTMLTCPCHTKFPSEDPTAWLDQADKPDGICIGLAHGATIDFDRDDATRAVIDPRRAETAGLDYLALGDWHGTGEAGPRAWYSGTPEQDNWKNNAAGQTLVVTIDAPGSAPKVEARRTGQYTWRRTAIDLTDTDIATALERATAESGRLTHLLLNATLTGTLPLATRADLDTALERLGDTLHYLRTDDSGLVISIGADSATALEGDEVLAETARRLAQQADTDDEDAAGIARGALQRLHTLARQTSGAA